MLSTRSPKGGSPISSLWGKTEGERNVIIDSDYEPRIIDDYLVYKIGYTTKEMKEAEAIFIKRSDAKKLLEILITCFGIGYCNNCGGIKK